MAVDYTPYARTPSPHPSPPRAEGGACRLLAATRQRRTLRVRHVFNSLRTSRSHLPLPSRERDGVRGLRRWRFGAGLLAAAALIALTFPARAELVHYQIVGDAIPASLTGARGDPDRGHTIVANHNTGLCLLCHSGPFPDDKFQGNLAPDLAGAGTRSGEGQLRLRIVDASKLNPNYHHAAVLPDRSPDPRPARVSRQAGIDRGRRRRRGCLSDDLEVSSLA